MACEDVVDAYSTYNLLRVDAMFLKSSMSARWLGIRRRISAGKSSRDGVILTIVTHEDERGRADTRDGYL